jgi:hypothetical protein
MTVLAGLAGLCLLGYLGVVALLIAVSLPGPSRQELLMPEQPAPILPDWTTTTELYIRNRSADYLYVFLTVARPALRPDTVWWNLGLTPEATGQALVLRDSLVTQGLYYPLAEPVLLPGTADTLIDKNFDKNFDENLPRELVHCKQYNSRPSAAVQAARYTINPSELSGTPDQRAFGQSLDMYFRQATSDSLHLVLYLAPDSALRVGRRRVAYFNAQGGLPTTLAGSEAPYFPPNLLVQHTEGDVRPLQRPPLARLLELPTTEGWLPHTGHRLVRRYWDCR